MKTKNLYFIEVTDTYGGEANYSWVLRYIIHANSERGAICKLARHDGAGWKKEYEAGDFSRYNLSGACVCCFVEWIDDVRAEEMRGHYSRIMEIK